MKDSPARAPALELARADGTERPAAPAAFPPSRSGPSPLEWVCLAVGVFLTLRYAWLMDDAFVYFRYADNAAFLGYGLVYNQGEHVEGFTSPLWMLLVLAFRLTGGNYTILVRAVGVLAFVGFWACLVYANRVAANRAATNRSAPPTDSAGRRPSAVNLPLCYLCACYGLLCYFTSGLETPLVLLAAGLYLPFAFRPGSRGLQAALGWTPLLRHELVLPLALAFLYAWRRERRFPGWMAAWAILPTAAWVAFRVWYYAELLPNTFYLKEDTNLAQGWRYVLDGTLPYRFPLFVLACAACLGFARRRGTELLGRERGFLLLCGTVLALWVVKVGGDARHFRFLAFPFVLWVGAGVGVVESAFAHVRRARVGPVRFGGAALGVSFLVAALTSYPPQLTRHPLLGGEFAGTHRRISDASRHRGDEWCRFDPWGSGEEIEIKEDYAGFLAQGGRYRGVFADGWCARIYRSFDRRCINRWGLTDPVLARVDTVARRPGHKLLLHPLAEHLVELTEQAGPPGRGMHRRAVEAGLAPRWVAGNLDLIETVERKVFNRRRLGENLRLALTFPGRIALARKPEPAGGAEAAGEAPEEGQFRQ